MIIEGVKKWHGFHVLLSGLEIRASKGEKPRDVIWLPGESDLVNLFLYSHVRRVFLLVSSLAANSNDPACSYFGFQLNCQGTEKPS